MNPFKHALPKWTALVGALVFVALLLPVFVPHFRQALAKGDPASLATVGKAMKATKEGKDDDDDDDDDRKKDEKKPKAPGHEKVEYRGVAYLADGTCYAATKHQVLKLADGALVPIEGYMGSDPHALVADPAGTALWVAAKGGLFRHEAGVWTLAYRGETKGLSFAPDGAIIAATKEEGLMRSEDGKSWVSWQLAAPAEMNREEPKKDKMEKDEFKPEKPLKDEPKGEKPTTPAVETPAETSAL
jgi:hypothetical protein